MFFDLFCIRHKCRNCLPLRLVILYGVKNGRVHARRSYKQKAPKPQKLWCKHFYALAYAPAGKPPKRDGTEYPDLVCGQKPLLSAKPSPLPRVTGAPAPIGKNITPYSAVSASGIHTPFLCTRAKVPVRALFLYVIFILCNYEPFRRICQ